MAETPAEQPTRHVPVLLDRCLELLGPAVAGPGAVLVDMTLGLGGHAEAFLRRFTGLRVVGLDRDAQALALASARLAPFAARWIAASAIDRPSASVAMCPASDSSASEPVTNPTTTCTTRNATVSDSARASGRRWRAAPCGSSAGEWLCVWP